MSREIAVRNGTVVVRDLRDRSDLKRVEQVAVLQKHVELIRFGSDGVVDVRELEGL